jgi:hypothetical protein
MTFWRLFQPVLVGSACVIGGVGLVYVASWCLAKVARWIGDDGPTLPDRPTPRHDPTLTDQERREEADAIRASAEQRRFLAAERYKDARSIASGETHRERRVMLAGWKERRGK